MEMEFKAMSVDELKDFLMEKAIKFSPYSQEEIDKAKNKLGGMPRLLEEYYLKIGWFADIRKQGYGCHIDPLEDIYIMSAEEIQEDFEDVENETDDYLVFGREAVSVDEFAVKVKDFGENDPELYIFGDSTSEEAMEQGLLFGKLEEEPNLSSMFNIIVTSLE